MKRIILLSILLLITSISTVFALTSNNLYNVLIIPSTNVKQGQTVFVKLKSKDKQITPHIVFNNKNIKMFKQKDGTFRGLIGIDALAKTGKNSIVIFDNSDKIIQKNFIKISSTRFPIQNIVVTGSKSSLDASKWELEKVKQAKYTISDLSYMNKPPYYSPTAGCIISVYGLNRYHNGKPTGDYHKGIDIKAPSGQRINTIDSGKVLIANNFRLHGGTVAVDHGQGVISFYLHMSKINVKKGDLIKTGQKIGEVGSTGYATGPHLHWGLYINGVPVNPMDYWVKTVNKCSG